MNRYAQITTLLLTLTFVLIGCKSVPQFSDVVVDRNWNLVEVRLKSETITIDRSKLAGDGGSRFYSMRFDARRISGVGAPNPFQGTYTEEEKQALSLKRIRLANTMSASRRVERPKEQEFVSYLQNTYKWNIVNERLELYSKISTAEVVLVFEAAY